MYRLKACLLIIGLISITGVLSPADAITPKEAEEVINRLGRKAINTLTKNDLEDDSFKDAFVQIFNEAFDMEGLASAVLGRYWREMSPEQRKRFFGLMPRILAKIYRSKFKEYQGISFEIISVRQTKRNRILVTTRLKKPGDSTSFEVGWIVNDKKRITDVSTEGFSTVTTYQREYQTFLDQLSGGVKPVKPDVFEKFLGTLQEKGN